MEIKIQLTNEQFEKFASNTEGLFDCMDETTRRQIQLDLTKKIFNEPLTKNEGWVNGSGRYIPTPFGEALIKQLSSTMINKMIEDLIKSPEAEAIRKTVLDTMTKAYAQALAHKMVNHTFVSQEDLYNTFNRLFEDRMGGNN